MKVNYLILALTLIVLVTADSLKADSKANRLNYHKLPAKGDRNEDNIYEFVDHAIKEKYWYYLTKACLLYLTSVDQGKNTFQFLAIYRNIVGTFLAITTWTQGKSDFQVNTLVRLGDGQGKKFGANYKPIAVRPLKLRYSLGANQVVLEFTDSWDIKVNGKCIQCHEDKDDHDLCVKECKQIDGEVRNKFWYYLQHAKVAYSNVAKTAARNYCLLTYVNDVGTFLVIGSSNKEQSTSAHKVNTFVRLGNGCADGAEYKPVQFAKIHLPLADFSD